MRIRLAIPTAALAAAAIALFVATPGAIATQGQPMLAGAQNTETSEALIVNTTQVSLNTCLGANPSFDGGLVACGFYGVEGLGKATGGGVGVKGSANTGVFGSGHDAGVYGSTDGSGKGVWGVSDTGTGVLGQNTTSTGIGVHGITPGTGSAVFGQATANGVGVNGSSKSGIAVKGAGGPTGVYGSGTDTGVEGHGGPIGVSGSGANKGVEGSATQPGGTGVYGETTGSTGIGVWGKTSGTGSAVYGQATLNGVGVYGISQSGTALRGDSPSGIALQVQGRAKFSRSGTVIVDATKSSKAVSLSGTTSNSMILAIAQQNANVFVKATVPGNGSFTIYLTGNAPAGGLKVAYFVLN